MTIQIIFEKASYISSNKEAEQLIITFNPSASEATEGWFIDESQ